MTRDQVRERIRSIGVIPAIRVATAEEAKFAVEAVASGGIPIVEITMTIKGAMDVIADLLATQPELIVGAGTVLNVETAKACIDAGVHFVTSPSLKEAVVQEVQKHGIVVIPGAMTPTEVSDAADLGVDFVKIFPCTSIGGPNYLRALRKPFPDLPMIAAGGVNQQSAVDFIRGGADILGIGTGLVSTHALSHHEAKRIRELAKRYVAIVQTTREELGITARECR